MEKILVIFSDNFSDKKNFKKRRIEKLETKLKQELFQSVISKPNDDDYLDKLKKLKRIKWEIKRI